MQQDIQQLQQQLAVLTVTELSERLHDLELEIAQSKELLRVARKVEPVWFDLELLRNRVASLVEAQQQCPELVPTERLTEIRHQLEDQKMKVASLCKEHPQLRRGADLQVKVARIEQNLQSLKTHKKQLQIELGLRRTSAKQTTHTATFLTAPDDSDCESALSDGLTSKQSVAEMNRGIVSRQRTIPASRSMEFLSTKR